MILIFIVKLALRGRNRFSWSLNFSLAWIYISHIKFLKIVMNYCNLDIPKVFVNQPAKCMLQRQHISCEWSQASPKALQLGLTRPCSRLCMPGLFLGAQGRLHIPFGAALQVLCKEAQQWREHLRNPMLSVMLEVALWHREVVWEHWD